EKNLRRSYKPVSMMLRKRNYEILCQYIKWLFRRICG
ncbi:MAG: hypothetical protein ACI9MF_000897, partial [Gammaproteobacteria bacterium]